MSNWHNPDCLGSARQRQAHAALAQVRVLELLREFSPVLAGTIPLGIDVAGSDLDIICEVPVAAHMGFGELLRRHFGHLSGFRWYATEVRGRPSVVGCFEAAGFAWEIFGQAQPAARQYAVRHLVVEHRILRLGGEAWHRAVQQLKQQGLKTEPAFAQLLRLPGDPYDALLELESWPEEQLLHRLQAARL